jgi:hypothetical protein
MPALELVRLMLGSGCAFGGGFLAIALIEAIDASCGIDQLLLAGKERVASGTNFNVQVTFLGGASLELLAARAGDGNINVFWVNSWFHLITLYRRRPGRNFKRDIVAEMVISHKGTKRRHEGTKPLINSCLSVFSLCLCVNPSSRFAPKRPHQHTPEYSHRTRPSPTVLGPDNSKSHQSRPPDTVAQAS